MPLRGRSNLDNEHFFFVTTSVVGHATKGDGVGELGAGLTKKKDLVTARSEATKQSLRNAPQMRDCFARRGLAMTFDFLLVTPGRV